MKAIIPAAGIGERLRPLTLARPKVLLPVAGKPILGHILDRVVESGISDVVLIVGYMSEQVVEFTRNNYELSFDFVEQPERKGLGHAVGEGLDDEDEPVLILLGDTILDLNFSEFVQKEQNTIGVITVNDPQRFGIVETKNNWVVKLVEKPKHPSSNLAIAGIYFMKSQKQLKRAIDYIIKENITTKGEYQLTDALQVMLTWGEKMQIEIIDACYDCGTRETLLDSNRLLLQNMDLSNREYPDSVIISPSYVHPEADIRRSVIGPNVSIGDEVTICDSVIKNSIIDSGSDLRNVVLKNSLIGSRASVRGKFYSADIVDGSRQDLS